MLFIIIFYSYLSLYLLYLSLSFLFFFFPSLSRLFLFFFYSFPILFFSFLFNFPPSVLSLEKHYKAKAIFFSILISIHSTSEPLFISEPNFFFSPPLSLALFLLFYTLTIILLLFIFSCLQFFSNFFYSGCLPRAQLLAPLAVPVSLTGSAPGFLIIIIFFVKF